MFVAGAAASPTVLATARISSLHAPAPLALIGVPFGHGAGIRGTELGPAAARLAGLPDRLGAIGQTVVDHGDIAAPEVEPLDAATMTLGNHANMVSSWIGATHDATLKALTDGFRPLIIGGDHSISMGSVSAAARHAERLGKRLVVLWIDAHADFNTPGTSPSGNLHGMSVAFLTGNSALSGLLLGREFPVVKPENIFLIGARSIDGDEKAAIAEAGINCLDMRMIDEFGICALVRDVLSGFDPARTHVHVSFDLDVIDPGLAPGVGTPVAGGLTYREAHIVMEMLHESGLVGSAEFVELNPMLDHAGATARLTVDLATSLYGKTISFSSARRNGMTRAA